MLYRNEVKNEIHLELTFDKLDALLKGFVLQFKEGKDVLVIHPPVEGYLFTRRDIEKLKHTDKGYFLNVLEEILRSKSNIRI